MRAWKYLKIILIILMTSGCSVSQKLVKDSPNKTADTYLQGISSGKTEAVEFIKENLKLSKAFGYVKPYVPIVEPADVRLVWLPTHKSTSSPEVLVSGHWVYIMVHQSRWFIDAQSEDKAQIPLIVPYKEVIKNDKN